MNKNKWYLLAYLVIFCLPLTIYLHKYYLHQTGADFLVRVAEAKYFLAGINPYDVFFGIKPVITAYGPEPAVYSFFSYLFGGFIAKISFDSQIHLLIFIIIDFLSLAFGILLICKLINININKNSQFLYIKPIIKLIIALVCSTYFWQHIYFLNYTLIAGFGLILLIYGLNKKQDIIALIGMLLIGLRPSLAIPVFIYLAFIQNWKILFNSIAEYMIILLMVSWKLDANPIDLLKQLAEVQRHFSDNLGYYHAEGALAIIQPMLGSYLSLLSMVIVCLIFLRYRNQLFNPLVSLILICACSVSFFYSQVHAWISVYPILLIALIEASKSKKLDLISLILIGWLIVPRLSSFVSDDYRYEYVVIYNLFRFSILWYCALKLINRLMIVEVCVSDLQRTRDAKA